MDVFGPISATWLGMDRPERWSIIMAIYGASVALFMWISYDFVGTKFVAWMKRKRRSLLVIGLIFTYSVLYWRFALPILSVQAERPIPPAAIATASVPAPAPALPPIALPPTALPAPSPVSPAIEARTGTRHCTVSDPTGSPMNVRATPRGEILGVLRNGSRVAIDRTAQVNDRTWVFAETEDGTLTGWVVLNYLRCDD